MSKNKSNKILLDIAIVTAGRVDLLNKCIDHLLPQLRPEYRVHIYNDGTPSPEYEEAYKKLPEGSVIKRSNQNQGFPVAANSSIRSGNAPLVLFITDDIFIHEGAIDTLIHRMDDPSIGICGYKFTFPEDSTDPNRPAGKVQHVGLGIDIKGSVIHPLMAWSADNPKCNISRDVPAVTGASFIIRRSVFNQARGFNPIYGRGYYEDVDLCFTVKALGFRVFFDAQATATHGVGQTFQIHQDNPPNIRQNASIFQTRWMGSLEWSEWIFW